MVTLAYYVSTDTLVPLMVEDRYAVASVPGSVTIPAGKLSASFTIRTGLPPGLSSAQVNISAWAPNYKRASLTVIK
jgi:hypothetical protein